MYLSFMSILQIDMTQLIDLFHNDISNWSKQSMN